MIARQKNKDPLDTPIMRQYLKLKAEHPDAILFFRMGDFYELFLEDAEIAAPIMDVALTQRQSHIPMCGVPYHSATIYLSRLVDAGKRVAIAEQKSDPANPKLMKRAVVRVLTPGTLIEEGLLEGADRNYLCALSIDGRGLGVALADIATGNFICRLLEAQGLSEPADRSQNLPLSKEASNPLLPFARSIRDLIYHYNPQEFLLSSDLMGRLEGLAETLPKERISYLEPWKASPTEGERRIRARFGSDLSGLGFPKGEGAKAALGAVSLVLHYLQMAFPENEIRIHPPVFLENEKDSMELDEATIRNLDLTENKEEGGAARSLFGILNFCKTAAGRRSLREAILSPLRSLEKIRKRQAHVSYFLQNPGLAGDLQTELAGVHDLERTLIRMSAEKAQPRDLGAIRSTLASARRIQEILRGFLGQNSKDDENSISKAIHVSRDLEELYEILDRHLAEELPVKLGAGELLRAGLDAELDEAREARDNGGRLMAEFESRERERHNLPKLRVKYNRVAGYFIEIPKAQARNAPEEYKRRQTLANAERFTCGHLRELEERLLAAETTIARIEETYFQKLCQAALDCHEGLHRLMQELSWLDFYLSLAEAARRYDWCRPELSRERYLKIVQGRHPVVEAFLPAGEDFTGNDLFLNGEDRQFAIITGPNMAGKSTYIRQIALIQILAQIGSWVPASEYTGSLVDRVFTRIGAHDNLTRGESTFYVEMLEAARILNQCTDRSLVIMDEVGRGTSTYDGISLAGSILEYLTGPGAHPLCLFATHYQELTALEERFGVFNLTMDVEEVSGKVLFLHSVKEGAADRSYGIHVARLAGMPDWVIERAEKYLQELEENSRKPSRKSAGESSHASLEAQKNAMLSGFPNDAKSQSRQSQGKLAQKPLRSNDGLQERKGLPEEGRQERRAKKKPAAKGDEERQPSLFGDW